MLFYRIAKSRWMTQRYREQADDWLRTQSRIHDERACDAGTVSGADGEGTIIYAWHAPLSPCDRCMLSALMRGLTPDARLCAGCIDG